MKKIFTSDNMLNGAIAFVCLFSIFVGIGSFFIDNKPTPIQGGAIGPIDTVYVHDTARAVKRDTIYRTKTTSRITITTVGQTGGQSAENIVNHY